MEFTPENVEGAAFYAGFLYSFLSFGLFTLMILGLLLWGLFPKDMRKLVVLGALGCSLMQWIVLIVDVLKYEAPWYYGILDPFRSIVDLSSYSSFSSFCGLVLPSLGIIFVTMLAFGSVLRYFALPEIVKPKEVECGDLQS